MKNIKTFYYFPLSAECTCQQINLPDFLLKRCDVKSKSVGVWLAHWVFYVHGLREGEAQIPKLQKFGYTATSDTGCIKEESRFRGLEVTVVLFTKKKPKKRNAGLGQLLLTWEDHP